MISGITRIPRGMRNAAKPNLCFMKASSSFVSRLVKADTWALSGTGAFFTWQKPGLGQMLRDPCHVTTVPDLSILCDEFEPEMSCCRYNRPLVNLRQFFKIPGFLD